MRLADLEALHRQRLEKQAAPRRERQQAAARKFLAQPHAIERAAAGVINVPRGVPNEIRQAIAKRAAEIARVRAIRRERGRPAPVFAGRWRGEPYRTVTTVRTPLRHHGIPIEAVWERRTDGSRYWVAEPRYRTHGSMCLYRRRSRAASAHLVGVRAKRAKPIYVHGRHEFTLRRQRGCWALCLAGCYDPIARVKHERDVDGAIRQHRRDRALWLLSQRAARRANSAPDTLGWRAWIWDGRVLRSPHQRTAWETRELRAEAWSDDDALRGVQGIHARRMPRDWLRAGWPDAGPQEGRLDGRASKVVTGIVERYGRYVLGATGWRAELAIIRELCAPDVATMLALIAAYPDVRVHLSPYATTTPPIVEEDTHGHR